MRHYWAEGNNLEFMELIYLVDQPLARSTTAWNFSHSFPGHVKKLWEVVSGAFTKPENDGMEDFIAEEGDETDTDQSGLQPFNPFREEEDDVEKEFVRRLRGRKGAGPSDSSDQGSCHYTNAEDSSLEVWQAELENDDDDDDDDDDDNEEENEDDNEDEEEDEDEWLSQKRVTPRKKEVISPSPNSVTSSGKKRRKMRKMSVCSGTSGNESDVDIANGFGDGSKSSTKKGRRVIEETEDSE